MKFTFFNDVITAIATLVGSDFSTLELDRNQLEEAEGLKSLLLPALFVDFPEGVDFEADTKRYKADLVEIKLTLAVQSVGDTVHTYLDSVISKLTDKILKVNNVAICQSLRLSKVELDKTKDDLDIAEITYETRITRLRTEVEVNTKKVKSKVTKVNLNK